MKQAMDHAKKELAIPIEAPPTTPSPPLMDKEEETQLNAPKESELAEIVETGKVENIEVAVKEISVAEAAEEPVKEEIKETSIPHNNATKETGETVAVETTELVKEEPKDQSDFILVSATLVLETGVASVTPNPEEQTKDPDCSTDARTDTETREEDKLVLEELVKEEIKEHIHATPVAVTETIDETKHAEPNREEENNAVELSHTTPATETVNESANLKPEAKLPEVETEGPKFQDISVAATGEEDKENKETGSVKEVIKEFEIPDSSLAVTPVVDGESTPETKTTDMGAVAEVHTEKERASDELKVENTDASPVIVGSADVESEVTQILPEKKKKPLGDHLAEEKANDSVNTNKQVSDEKLEVELSEVEQIANAVALKESTEISSRDANAAHDTKSEANEKKEEDEKAAREVTTTEFAQVGEGEKLAEKESTLAGEAAKEEVASKLTSRSSNNILSKVKHQIVKVKKAIVRKPPKNKPMENKDDIKIKSNEL